MLKIKQAMNTKDFKTTLFGEKRSNLVFPHLPGGYKIRQNGKTKEDMMPALVKQQKQCHSLCVIAGLNRARSATFFRGD